MMIGRFLWSFSLFFAIATVVFIGVGIGMVGLISYIVWEFPAPDLWPKLSLLVLRLASATAFVTTIGWIFSTEGRREWV